MAFSSYNLNFNATRKLRDAVVDWNKAGSAAVAKVQHRIDVEEWQIEFVLTSKNQYTSFLSDFGLVLYAKSFSLTLPGDSTASTCIFVNNSIEYDNTGRAPFRINCKLYRKVG